MPCTFRCAVCERSRNVILFGRSVSARKEYRILQMTGLVLDRTINVAKALVLVKRRHLKLCWEHSEQSLYALTSHEQFDAQCDGEKDSSESKEDRHRRETSTILKLLDPQSTAWSVIDRYLSDERKAIEDRERKTNPPPPLANVRFVSVSNLSSEQHFATPPAVHACDLFSTEVKKEQFKGPMRRYWSTLSSYFNRSKRLNPILQEECEASTSLTSRKKRERKQDISKAYDREDGSETCCESNKPSKDVVMEAEHPQLKTKDGRCGTSTCACCQFYQNELKKMTENLQNLQRNWNKLQD